MLTKIKENKFLKIAMNIVKTLVTAFLVILVCIIFIQRVTNNNFTIGGVRVFTIVTGSMLPEYEIGDMIVSIETNPDKIEVGDNVVYQGKVGDFSGKIVTHKVIKKTPSGDGYTFITKGTNNTIEDPEIDDSQIMGKVIYKTFILSFISKLLAKPAAFFFIVFVPFVILVFLEIVDVCEERRNSRDEDIEEEDE